ncbi:MAG: hypothetical protein CMJ24_08885 [Phycisphaerae bacterium]|nr:hypothetical protein [Phycisphaerae bacterium]|tara:strand:- start:855 stop:1961 length:1107 start_codon:yes stop_codon:yes gene_type:complete
MIQTLALFSDAYRLLNARKIFWFTLLLTALVVLAFLMVGIHETGIRIIVWDIDLPINTSSGWSESLFYKTIFMNLGVKIWLTWVATILGLITTASIFPEFISTGSIEVILSKPIGRFRLFLTKYATGLLFVTLQVSVFTVGSFLVIGIKSGIWMPGIFIAIPIVVLFFSYLYAICAFFGVVTKSTIAALLLTILCWFCIFIVQTSETTLLFFVKYQEQEIQAFEDDLQRSKERLAGVEDPDDHERWKFLYETIEVREKNLKEANESNGVRLTHNIIMGALTVLPKTDATIELLERWTIDLSDLPQSNPDTPPPFVTEDGDFEANEQEITRSMSQDLKSRSPLWIIGTSLLFELFVCGFAGWLFCRRDY